MLLIDDRTGSKELAPLLADYSIPVRVTRIRYGDFSFTSPHGPTDPTAPPDSPSTCSIAIERKTVGDLISSIESKRLSGLQLPGMLATYDFVFLVVEGEYWPDHNSGKLQVRGKNGRMSSTLWKDSQRDYRMVDGYLNTLRMKGPKELQIIKTPDPQHTACEIYMLYHWFRCKRWDSHRSHLDFEPDPLLPNNRVMMSKPSFFRQVVSRFPNVGMERTKQAAQIWGSSVHAMVNAGVEELAMLDGITLKRAQDIWRKLRNVDGEGSK